MKITRRWMILILWVGGSTLVAHGQGYQIDFFTSGEEFSNLNLGFYQHGKTYMEDSAIHVERGHYVFRGDESLAHGMYFISHGTNLLFDFVIGEDQTFELYSDGQPYFQTMKVVGNEDNQLYFENIRFNQQMSELGAPYIEILRDSVSSWQAKEQAQKEVEAINGRVKRHQDSIITTFPNSLLAILLKSGKQVEVPDELRSGQDQKSRLKAVYYYRKHYWDYFDLGNPLLLRLPRSFYKEKVDDYLDNLIRPIPDSLKVALDDLIASAKGTETTYQYLVWHLTTKYQSSTIMGLDEVFVYLVDEYFATGEMDFWANDQLKRNLQEKADQYRSSLIGSMAANLVLQDLTGKPRALYDLPNKYTVIYFYDPDCGHCKKETPVLKTFHEMTPYDVGVYSVSADSSMTKMQAYIEEVGVQDWTNTNGTRTFGLNYQEVYDAYTTPTIYLLNEKKEIIAKKISAAQLGEVIKNYETANQ